MKSWSKRLRDYVRNSRVQRSHQIKKWLYTGKELL